jgi:hypothetical protein
MPQTRSTIALEARVRRDFSDIRHAIRRQCQADTHRLGGVQHWRRDWRRFAEERHHDWRRRPLPLLADRSLTQ